MKPGAYFINVGRGEQVEEAALIKALSSRHIAGAALDVFKQEPLPADSPLWDVEKLFITPHTAARPNNCGHATTLCSRRTFAATWHASRCYS